jgi:hypothetical protein
MDDLGCESWHIQYIYIYIYIYKIYTYIKSKMALGPTQPPIWWVQELLPQGKSGWGVRMVTYLHLVPRVRMDAVLYMPS